jgi:hypothetical protein
MKAVTVHTEGSRVVRAGTYMLDPGDGEPPQVRAFIAAGWASQPLTPFGAELVDVPLTAVPELIAALSSLTGEA